MINTKAASETESLLLVSCSEADLKENVTREMIIIQNDCVGVDDRQGRGSVMSCRNMHGTLALGPQCDNDIWQAKMSNITHY